MSNGFIKICRKIRDWRWWSDDAVLRFFIGIILLANYKDAEFKGETIKRGSFVTSIPNLCTYLEMSERKVRRCLECLKSTGEITDIANNHFRVITVVNYDEYQDVLPLSKKQGKRQGNKQGKRKVKGQDKEQGNKQGKRYPIEESKKCVCLTDTHTQQENNSASPGALGERGHAAVTWNEIRQYQIDNHIGGGEIVDDFYDAFKKSGTRIPDNWQDLYCRFARADYDAQLEFAKNLKDGKYYDKWGKADE